MSDISKKGPSGHSYKITTFSKEYAKRKGHPGRHYLALFNPGQITATEGWFTGNLRQAKADGAAHIRNRGEA